MRRRQVAPVRNHKLSQSQLGPVTRPQACPGLWLHFKGQNKAGRQGDEPKGFFKVL